MLNDVYSSPLAWLKVAGPLLSALAKINVWATKEIDKIRH
jgi:hypothetical protein